MSENIKTRPPVVVAGLWYTGAALMRCLRRQGITVYGVDCVPAHLVYAKHYGPVSLCPSPDADPGAWVRFMQSLSAKIGVQPVLMAAADVFTLAIAGHTDELVTSYIFRPEAYKTQALLATKLEQYRIAEEFGMPIALSRVAATIADVEDFSTKAQFPCLLKPRHARSWIAVDKQHKLFGKKVIVAASPKELFDAYTLAETVDPNVVLQEIIAGPDSNKFVYLSCWGKGGRRLGSVVTRAYRSYPVNFGSCSTVYPVKNSEVEGICERFLSRLEYSGFCEIELKLDERDNKVKMIEANPRYSTTSDAAQYGGVNIGWMHYQDLIGEQLSPTTTTRWNWRHVHILRETGVLLNRKEYPDFSWWQWLKSVRPPVHFLDWHWGNWRLIAETILTVMINIRKRIRSGNIPI